MTKTIGLICGSLRENSYIRIVAQSLTQYICKKVSIIIMLTLLLQCGNKTIYLLEYLMPMLKLEFLMRTLT
jgi:NAD(P)H-dependent FMN reductase